METLFSHELVSVIKRACFARHGNTVWPTLLVVTEGDGDDLMKSVFEELSLDSTLSVATVSAYDDALLTRSLISATVVLNTSLLSRTALQSIAVSEKPFLEWEKVKRDACPLFWPAHSVMDFFIVHQDSLVTSPIKTISHEGEE